MEFIPFHLYSGASYLQSGLTPERIVLLAKKLGYTKVGLSDRGTLSGLAPFAHACKKEGILPYFGMDYPLMEGDFTLFAMNEEGYRNLLFLTKEYSEGHKGLDLLKDHQQGLAKVYSLPDIPSFVSRYGENPQEAGYDVYQTLKGLDVLFFALPYGLGETEKETLRAFSKERGYPLIAFPKILYPKKEDAIVLDIVTAILEKSNLEHKEKEGIEYFLSKEEVAAYYLEEEIGQTERLGSLLSSFELIRKRGGLLVFPNPLGMKSEEYLRLRVEEGLKAKGVNENEEYRKRADYELGIIDRMGYADYFLIVADYVNWAKTHGVMVGPGRGSGAGSLVSYALGIVGADPIRYGLLFERFLNPERQSMPDIDVDFADTTRDRVIHYLQEKYGEDHTGHVLTSQVIGAKESLRDIGRVYRYPQNDVELVISMIMDDRLSLREDYKGSKKFRDLINSDPYFLEYVRLASKIEGLPRQAGLHAAGIVLNDQPLEQVAPVSVSPEVGYVCCLEKDYLEEQGFLKMDLLGLTNLSTIERCLALIKRDRGIVLDYEKIPFEDPEGISLIRKGQTMGLFQLESAGMKRAIAEVGPTSFQDVAALLALFRPGPMESIPSYARRKKGQERVTYLSPELEPILKETYGIIVYQEQIMQICRVSAGMSYGQADLFRRAISKKNAAKLLSLKSSFVDGAKKNGHSDAQAERLYALIERFANYGFNKSHAVSYAVLTCQMAYLKARYPEEFYSAILDAMSPGDAKFKNTLSEAKKCGLLLALPDVNKSEAGFVVDEKRLRCPLSLIKGMPGAFIAKLLDERAENGPFKDIFDFAARMKRAALNTQLLVRLIDAGAFDSLYPSRASLRASAYSAISYAEMLYGEKGDAILLDLGLEKPVMSQMPDDKRTDLFAEYEALGMMISDSPLSFYKDEIAAKKAIPLGDIASAGPRFLTYGIVKSCRAITTKKGGKMAFLELYDAYNEGSFTLFSDAYNDAFPLLKNDALLFVTAHADSYREGSYVVDRVEPIEKGESL